VTPGPLTDVDKDAAFHAMVPPWFIERLDTRLGTTSVVQLLKSQGQCYGHSGPCEDGPFSDGKNAEWWARSIDRIPSGCSIVIRHEARKTDETTVLRSGRMTWNELANRSTYAALAHRRATSEPVAGEQIPLFA
jgi:hypothetical protein